MKKTVLILLSFILVCFCTFDIQVFASEESKKWDRQGEYGGKAEISIDTTQKCGNGEYSIKITNTDYGVSRVEKTFDVKPHTMYRASVMVKCVDFEKTTDSKYDFGRRIVKRVKRTSERKKRFFTYNRCSGRRTGDTEENTGENALVCGNSPIDFGRNLYQ